MALTTDFLKQKSGKGNNYWRIISPKCRQETEIFYFEVSVYWWKTNFCTVDEGKKRHYTFILYLRPNVVRFYGMLKDLFKSHGNG
jgi:hypothetical protein